MIGDGFVVGGGMSWPDKGQKVDSVLLLHSSGRLLSGGFQTIGCSFVDRSQSVFVLGIEGSSEEVSVKQRPGLAIQRAQSSLLVAVFCYYAASASHFSKFFGQRKTSPAVDFRWFLFSSVRKT